MKKLIAALVLATSFAAFADDAAKAADPKDAKKTEKKTTEKKTTETKSTEKAAAPAAEKAPEKK
jgi:Ni/Co efflux regulator RcnB